MDDITDRWTHVQTLFEQALDRPADERTAWLRAACGSDPDLYREVEALLEGDLNQHTVFAGRALDLMAPADLEDALVPSHTGERVGPWLLGERIGSGGMGAVYRAERVDAFEQEAALKRIKPGMDSEAVLERFRAERQILARLGHPGIARLLDGGLAPDGRPYFAMELVEGEPITDYADRLGLEVDARLELFTQVCDAVAYAHRQLVVHRDLKPSNVLVTPGGVVKLLDFGIARVLSDDLEGGLTRTGQRVLTPAYAAPEQHRGEPPSTATDAYALGVLLYRLLSGTMPIEGGELAALAPAPTGPPPRPSTRVEDAARRRALEGDLDVICLKALRVEVERRYGSAAELGADVRRVLEGVPIEARPATARYRARLFVRRHRAGVLATAAALVVAVALTGFYTVRLANERDRAEAETRRSEEVVSFLQTLLLGASPYETPGEEMTARELVDRGAELVTTDLEDEPATQAALQVLIGDIYLDLGRAEDAVPLYRRALATRMSREGAGADVLEAATASRQLGRALRDLEEVEEAEERIRWALATLEGAPNADPADIALTQRHLASLIRDSGDFEAAEALYRQALATARQVRGPDDDLVLDITTSLVVALRAQDKLEEAADLMAEVVASDRRTKPANDPQLASSIVMHSTLLGRAGRSGDALEAAREAARIFRAAHPDTTHPDIASSIHGIALALKADGQLDAADRTFDDALRRLRVAHGDRDVRVITALKGHALLKESLGQPDAAAALFRQAAEGSSDAPANQAILLSYLADNRARAQRWPESLRAFRRSVALLQEHGDDDDLEGVITDWATASREGGRPDLADEALRQLPSGSR